MSDALQIGTRFVELVREGKDAEADGTRSQVREVGLLPSGGISADSRCVGRRDRDTLWLLAHLAHASGPAG